MSKLLELENPKWADFDVNFGNENSITNLIRAARDAPMSKGDYDEPWSSLWEEMFHQGDVYSTAFAIVPHFVQIAQNSDAEKQHYILVTVSGIEAYRHKADSPSVPKDLEEGYFEALERAKSITFDLLKFEWSDEDYQYLLGALAIFQGKYKFGLTVQELEKTQFCPHCDEEFIVNGYNIFDE